MERLVREELERWDSDSNIDSGAGGGSGSATQRASPGAASGGRARSSNPSQNVSFPHPGGDPSMYNLPHS